MKICLVRHAETEWNYEGKLQGCQNMELNETGIRQAKKLKLKISNLSYDYCYMSPLIRSVQTAIILIGDRVETIPDKRLVERNLGELEGKSRDLYDAKKYWDYNLNSNDLGVEPVQDIFKRCEDFLEYIKSKYDKDTSILIVTHNAPCRALRLLIQKKELKGVLLDNNKIDNCYCEEFEI